MLLLIRSALHFIVTVPRGGIMALGNGKGSMTPAPWPLLGRVGSSASPHHCTEWGRTDRGQRRRWTDGRTENKKGNSAEFAESQRTDGQKDACNFASPPSAPPAPAPVSFNPHDDAADDRKHCPRHAWHGPHRPRAWHSFGRRGSWCLNWYNSK